MNTDQIAEEAAKSCAVRVNAFGFFRLRNGEPTSKEEDIELLQQSLKSIIKSAIERAWRYFVHTEPLDPNRTPMWLDSYDVQERRIMFTRICQTYEDALAETRAQSCRNVAALAAAHKKQLAAERETREKTELACEQWIRQCEDLQQQLLGPKQYPAPENELGDSSGDTPRAAHASEEGNPMNTKQIAEEQWTEETVRMIIADVPVGDAPEVIAAAHNSAIVDRRELAHREYHRGYQDGRKSLAAYRAAQTAID